ncbi:uncharacterized protein K444DRAFT_247408 [Hyaloscypha bicolor E]|uniref:Uncharacterized protein n=1 Tax=Hyaloscypha bicolor E TaxID=1095630 RepID=A0A2J6SMI7_9HELO|nr:uncharacterized protein K444DRAFT_247408 [Hyaloscypha bicolor E]PMD51940.1 hypothetical protein K444DRAFT_247408 [Hyaloscypha bicolor E]
MEAQSQHNPSSAMLYLCHGCYCPGLLIASSRSMSHISGSLHVKDSCIVVAGAYVWIRSLAFVASPSGCAFAGKLGAKHCGGDRGLTV